VRIFSQIIKAKKSLKSSNGSGSRWEEDWWKKNRIVKSLWHCPFNPAQLTSECTRHHGSLVLPHLTTVFYLLNYLYYVLLQAGQIPAELTPESTHATAGPGLPSQIRSGPDPEALRSDRQRLATQTISVPLQVQYGTGIQYHWVEHWAGAILPLFEFGNCRSDW